MNLENNGERMDIDFYNMNYERFDMYQKSHYRRYEMACNLVDPNDIIGDMACGSGYGTIMLSKKCNKVHGYDIDSLTINEIKKRYINETSVTFTETNLLNLNIDGIFDKVISFETIEHFTLEELKILIPLIHKSLKSDGMLIFSTPYNQEENQYSRVFHKTFQITENKIPEILNNYFLIEKFLYQDYISHTVVEDTVKKDFIICIAKKNNG